MKKLRETPAAALADLLHDGMTIAAGGFGLCGIPEKLIAAIRDSGVNGLTIISNNCGVDDFGLGILLRSRQVRKMISPMSARTRSSSASICQGNWSWSSARKARWPSASAPAARVSRASIRGRALERWSRRARRAGFSAASCTSSRTGLVADLAIVKAWKADTAGNLIYRKTARNFNPMVATCGRITVAEVEEIVPAGAIGSDHVHTPGIFIDRIVLGRDYEKRIEQRTLRREEAA